MMRSITGEGLRATHDILSSVTPLHKQSFPTGQKVMDWEIPQEWVYNKACIKSLDGEVLLNAEDHHLHIWNYSKGYNGKVSIEELEKHVETHEEFIPYKTVYYEDTWGFSMTKDQWETISTIHDEVIVEIDAGHAGGQLDIAYENYIGLSSGENYLFNAYTCHPQQANNGLSGMVINILLAEYVSKIKDRKNNYTFLFCPETIGAIAWMSTCVDAFKQPITYKKAFMVHCCGSPGPIETYATYPGYGGNERQFELYGNESFSIMTGLPEQYYQYHTSGDNLEFIDYGNMAKVLDIYKEWIDFMEAECKPKRKFNCEPWLKKHGIEFEDKEDRRIFMRLWQGADGKSSLDEISTKYGITRRKMLEMIKLMREKELIE
jgi:aminopeptidase-like protein